MSASGILIADRYRLESRIAAGSVGEVWRAEDLVLGRPVAVKVLQEGYASHPQTLARFRAEARHAGSLAHPGVAHVYDYGETGPAGRPYLVLELVNGPSLAGVLAGGPLDPAATMGIVAQVAAGLAAAHAAGLVHRDIKPANLLMGRDGQVKITDFGIAHAAGSAPITQVGTLVGTPAYLAPERGAGDPATPASDLYSLGMVAYECLTGTLPFHGTPLEVASASRFGSLPALPADVPAPVTALVSDLTAKDPAARPGSSAEVAARAAQLRDAMNGGPLAGPAAGRAPTVRACHIPYRRPARSTDSGDGDARLAPCGAAGPVGPGAAAGPGAGGVGRGAGRRAGGPGRVASGQRRPRARIAGVSGGGTAGVPGGPHAGATDRVRQRCRPGRPSGRCRAPATG